MRLGIIVVLWLCLCPMGVGLGRESGGLNSSAQAGAPAPASEGSAAPSGQAQNAARKPLTNDDVVGMLKAGLAENTIVLAIQHSSAAFDTSPQALIALHNQAVPPTVIDAMLKAGSEKSTSPAGSGASPASTPAKTRANPPKPLDLHTIRKVFMETNWEDDDNVNARKAISVQKHTCLQVVETEGAADAILAWSVEAFTGGALELRSKDGQVLWYRVGSFTTPLKALKEALGCPK